ncbi:MAG: DUF2029 domain-containing protein [Betaproteobacteria bacterium]|nr:DUF2029 domain-containing protein [Betaproteobacteria bacterium]
MKKHWLNPARVRLYSAVMLGVFVSIAFGLVWYSNLVDPSGYTIISDLTVFWTAAQMGLTGHAAQAYSVTDLRESVLAIFPNVQGNFGWFYPPSFYLCILPLGYLQYVPAYFAFMVPTLMFYVFVIRSIIWNREAGWALVSFSGIWINLLRGQNGFLTAGLAGAGLKLLDRHPILSGLVIGLTTIKPHLAILFPVALVAARAWDTLLAAAFSAGLILAGGVLFLGTDTWFGWLHSLAVARHFAEQNGPSYWIHMPTFFAFFRLLHVPVEWAYAAHGTVASLACLSVWKSWRSKAETALRAAILVTATLLISPYLLEYDLTWLALPAAWMALLAQKQGWARGEREMMVLMWLLPVLCSLGAKWISIQIGPWGLLLLLWMLWRKVRTSRMNAPMLHWYSR